MLCELQELGHEFSVAYDLDGHVLIYDDDITVVFNSMNDVCSMHRTKLGVVSSLQWPQVLSVLDEPSCLIKLVEHPMYSTLKKVNIKTGVDRADALKCLRRMLS